MASKYLQQFPVPKGFDNMLHDFAREVLRENPDNIYEFGWLYFKALEDVSYMTIHQSHNIETDHLLILGCAFRI